LIKERTSPCPSGDLTAQGRFFARVEGPLQAQLLARHLRGDLDAYPPFLWK